jgi:DHA1 family multidrug resistance protein-like MFS transporter
MMLLRAMFGGTIFVSLMSLVQAPWQLLLLRMVQGCLTGTTAAATVLTAGISPRNRVALTLGLITTGVAVGNSIGPLIGGVIADFIGRRAAFLSTGIVLALAGFIILFGVTDDKHPAPAEAAKKKKQNFFADFKLLAGDHLLLVVLFVFFGIQAANTIANPMMPLFIKQLALEAGNSPRFIGSATGVVLGVGAAATAIGSVTVGKYADRIGYWRALIVCLVLGAVLRVPQALVVDNYQLGFFRAVSSFFIGACTPLLNAIIATGTAKERQGAAYGLSSSFTQTGGALGPVIGSAVAMISLRAVFLAASAVMVVSALMVVAGRKKRA